jgi:hypothetical protein
MPALRALQPSIYGEYRGAGRPLGRQLDPGMLNPGPVYTYIRTHFFRGLVVGVEPPSWWGWLGLGVVVVGGVACVGAVVYLRGGGFGVWLVPLVAESCRFWNAGGSWLCPASGQV